MRFKSQNTLIDWAISIFIAAIATSIIYSIIVMIQKRDSAESVAQKYDYEVKCFNGYKIIARKGKPEHFVQFIDDEGKGARCQ